MLEDFNPMLIVAVNIAFALLFFFSAWRGLRRALPFLRLGWTAVSVAVKKPDFREDVESRRAINEGSRFLIGGVIWLLAGLGGIGLGLFFSYQAVRMWLNPPPQP
jgi:hypothetical protein